MDKKKLDKLDEIADKVSEIESINILDVLLDEENKDAIVLSNTDGNNYSFEQIAVIPYKEKLYAILRPIEKLEGIGEDEAVVFFVNEENPEEPYLVVEPDEAVAIEVFNEYYNLLDEDNKN